MSVISFPNTYIRLLSPTADDLNGRLENGIVHCLAAAFGSGVWARSPMPVGDCSDPHSARGIVAQLKPRARVLVASSLTGGGTAGRHSVIGCVLGCTLDDGLIEEYGLGDFDARPNDALLAYIGVDPASQGIRATGLSDGRYAVRSRRHDGTSPRGTESIAGVLFSRWLALPDVASCPRVFVRTRSVLRPVLHMIERNGFDFCGQFDLDFHGQRQERLVFSRVNRPQAAPIKPAFETASRKQMSV